MLYKMSNNNSISTGLTLLLPTVCIMIRLVHNKFILRLVAKEIQNNLPSWNLMMTKMEKHLPATFLRYFINAEYTSFSNFLLFDPSSENTGFNTLTSNFTVKVLDCGASIFRNVGSRIPT